MVHIVGNITIKTKVFLCPGGNLMNNVILEQQTIIYSFGLYDFLHFNRTMFYLCHLIPLFFQLFSVFIIMAVKFQTLQYYCVDQYYCLFKTFISITHVLFYTFKH